MAIVYSSRRRGTPNYRGRGPTRIRPPITGRYGRSQANSFTREAGTARGIYVMTSGPMMATRLIPSIAGRRFIRCLPVISTLCHRTARIGIMRGLGRISSPTGPAASTVSFRGKRLAI